MIRLARAYVKANLHGSLGTIIPEGSCPAYGRNSSSRQSERRASEGGSEIFKSSNVKPYRRIVGNFSGESRELSRH